DIKLGHGPPSEKEVAHILSKVKEGTDTAQQFLGTLLDKCLVEKPTPQCIGAWARVCAVVNETQFLNVPYLRWVR
ncbi:hypothetical protein SARC_16615, partial [Sphaeroforma arctica JP610]